MNSKFFVLLLVVASALVPAAAVAQEDNSTSTPTFVDVEAEGIDRYRNVTDAPEVIDAQTRVIDERYVDGRMIIIVESDEPQFVTIVDAVRVMSGGVAKKHRVPLREGLNRIEIPAMSDSGTAAITIDTGPVIKGVVVEHSPPLIRGPFTADDVYLSAAAGALSVAIVAVGVTIRAVTGRSESPERLTGP